MLRKRSGGHTHTHSLFDLLREGAQDPFLCAVLAANLKGAAGALTRLRNQGRGMEGLGGRRGTCKRESRWGGEGDDLNGFSYPPDSSRSL